MLSSIGKYSSPIGAQQDRTPATAKAGMIQAHAWRALSNIGSHMDITSGGYGHQATLKITPANRHGMQSIWICLDYNWL